MLNTPEFYTEIGKAMAKARDQHDEARAAFHKNHFSRARGLESGRDKEVATDLFDRAYMAERR